MVLQDKSPFPCTMQTHQEGHAKWRLDEGHFTRRQWKLQCSQQSNSIAGTLASEEMTLGDLGVEQLI